MTDLTVNGRPCTLGADPHTPLLWVLRDALGLKGTKYGCGVGRCGICTVLIDGAPNHACMVPLARAAGRTVTTIEGLASTGHPLIEAWIAEQVPQCGYCQPGQLLAAAALLAAQPRPTDEAVDAAMAGVLCRCGTYARIRRAIHRAAGLYSEPSPVIDVNPPAAPAPDAGVALNPWLRVHGDNTVTVTISHAELGQGVLTALAMLVAEELAVDLDRVRTAFAPVAAEYVNPVFGVQLTGGSTAVRGLWEPLRRAGAQARARLIAAAARDWGVRARECQARDGTVSHPPSGRALTYAQLAPHAAKLKPPRRAPLAPPEHWRLLGRPVARLDIPDMVRGRTRYGIDRQVPDMLVASIERCPFIGGRLKNVDTEAARAVAGVQAVETLGNGVAVLARDFPTAQQGRAALRVEWEPGPLSGLDCAGIYEALRRRVDEPGRIVRHKGSVRRALARAVPLVEACYRTSYLAHATLEPMNCIARVEGGRCDLWVGTQDPNDARETAARLTGLSRERVAVHNEFSGGGFGRRLKVDMVAEAVELATRAGRPVQVVWTRADDLQHDFYRPAHVTLLKGALGPDGNPSAWWQRAAGPGLALDGIDMPYAIPNQLEECVLAESEIPVGAWRAVGPGQNAFAVEGFIDELAHAAGADPYAYRRKLLDASSHHRGALDVAAARASWGGRLPDGHGRGIAVYRSFGCWVAQVAEVSVTEDQRIRVHRVVCAVDCGTTVNPDTVRAQMEGAIAMGLSAALHEEVLIEDGRMRQATFADYPILTLPEMPAVEVHILDNREPPGGVGEPGLPPVAPAVANAVYVATGRRLRSLPLRLDDASQTDTD